jgi:glutamine synthetase adenylyltransferase
MGALCLIKARAITARLLQLAARGARGDRAPFVYRKYLDYGSLGAMRRLHAECAATWRGASLPTT